MVTLATASCAGGTPHAAPPALRGAHLEVLAVWSGAEQQRFERVLRAFERQTGATVTYTSAGHSVPEAVDARLAAGNPPDVAFLPQPGLLRRYARQGAIAALPAAVARVVARNYASVWRDLGTVDGRLYGVWFKAADKSLLWYNVAAFERAGVVPPEDLDDLLPAAQAVTAPAMAAFAVAGADRWTLTDWFENLYLRLAGPEQYQLLAEHRLAWTDDSVRATLTMMSSLLAPSLVAGGTDGALGTTFEQSVGLAFGREPSAAMLMEGDFVAGLVTGSTTSELGIDADVVPFPRRLPADAAIVGGGDAAVVFTRSRGADAFLAYLATPAAAAIWASQGGFVSPNENLELTVYPDRLSRDVARRVLEAGDDFRFDLSDLQPTGFGGSNTSGMRKLLQDFLTTRDVDATAAGLEAAAAAAFRR